MNRWWRNDRIAYCTVAIVNANTRAAPNVHREPPDSVLHTVVVGDARFRVAIKAHGTSFSVPRESCLICVFFSTLSISMRLVCLFIFFFSPLHFSHGGGKRCKIEGCSKSAVGGSTFCTSHGGGRRCHVDDCNKSAQSSTNFCVKHGGGKKCQREGCEKVSRGRTQYCAAVRIRKYNSNHSSLRLFFLQTC